MNLSPKLIEPLSATELLLSWSNEEKFSIPYLEIRYSCPCAGCVNEHTGRRMIEKNTISSDIRVKNVHLVGRYAVQFSWSDGHETGMYHYDTLYEICQKLGKQLH